MELRDYCLIFVSTTTDTLTLNKNNMNTLTIANLKKLVAKKNNWEIEINEPSAENGLRNKEVGIHKGNEIWYWFYEDATDGYLFFNQSYNRNTGEIKKGSSYGANQRMSLIKAIEKLN